MLIRRLKEGSKNKHTSESGIVAVEAVSPLFGVPELIDTKFVIAADTEGLTVPEIVK